MKKVLFFALMAAAVIGCKRSDDAIVDPEPELTDAIMLSAGGTVVLGRAAGDTTANKGPRTNEFAKEDQIGVYAVYTDHALDPATPKPVWSKPGVAPLRTGRYFDNMPATCKGFVAQTTPASGRWASFLWGMTGQGGVGVDQLYPKGEDSIFVYAYYPFAADSMTVIDDAATEAPRRKIRLDTLSPLQQADILWAVGQSKAAVPYIKRVDPLAPLTFKHALAQLNFKIYKKGPKVANGQFVSIKFRCPVYGEMRISDGNMYITDKSVKDSVGTYTIKAGQVGSTEITYQANMADIPYLLKVPYMVLPMSKVQAEKCELIVTVYFGNNDPDTDPDNVRTYPPINLSSIKAFVQGSLNTLLLSIGDEVIELLADIEPWDTSRGNESGLDIE